jgi:uncharacterized protein YndB with AHSA1/START domain
VPFAVETRTGIATPPAPVWGLLVDTRSWKGWWPAVRDARSFDFKPLHQGSRFEVTLQMGSLPRTVLTPVVSLAADGKALSWDARWLGVPLRQEWYLDPKPDGCRATARLRFDGAGGTVLRLLRLARPWERMLLEQLRGLKRVGELL